MRSTQLILTAAVLTSVGAAALLLHFEHRANTASPSAFFPPEPAFAPEPASKQEPLPGNSATLLSPDAFPSAAQPGEQGNPTGNRPMMPAEPLQNPGSKFMVAPEHPKGKQLASLIQGGVTLELLLDPFRAWAIEEPVKSAHWVERYLEGGLKARLLSEAVAIWSKTSPDKALHWLDTLQDTSGLEGAFEAALHASAKRDPSEAAVWLAANDSHGSLENWQTVLTVWGEIAPGEAAEFFSSQISPFLRDALLSSALIGMREGAAADLLLHGVDGPTADRALASAAKTLSFGAPQYALQLAERIADAELRIATSRETLSRWRDTNPAEAFSYAASRRLEMPAPAALKAISPPAPPSVEISPSR